MRCLYCHNPDTWQIGAGKKVEADELIAEYEKNRSFYRKGGITVTGGEPLLQIEFVTELFEKAKSVGIHTCIDTSGIVFNPEKTEAMDRLMRSTDLVMLDIKHIDADRHRALTGHDNRNILAFAKYLEQLSIPLWVRHIVVEGYTDAPEWLVKLGQFLGTLSNLKALDVLPYHTMGVNKYRELGIPYPLDGLSALPVTEAVKAKELILQGIRQTRHN